MDYITRNLETVVEQVTKEYPVVLGNRTATGGKDDDASGDKRIAKPDSGKVYAAGEDVGEADLIRLRRKIGYVIQNKGLFPHMTVEKTLFTFLL